MFVSLSTLMILAIVFFVLGFISPFVLICFLVVRADVD